MVRSGGVIWWVMRVPRTFTFVDLSGFPNHTAEVCAPLALRVGIASGHALLFEGDDYIGSAVNMASRLCDAAGPFEVLMPSMQLDRLPQGVHARPAGGL